MLDEHPLYLPDLITGLLAALAQRRVRGLSLRGHRLDKALEKLFTEVLKEAEAHNLSIRFRIRTHPIHQGSPLVHEALYEATQRDLVSFDNPEFASVTLKLTAEEAPRYLAALPGSPDMYKRLADRLLQYYQEDFPRFTDRGPHLANASSEENEVISTVDTSSTKTSRL